MANSIETPYVGPRTFEEKDSRFFFGREREARDLLWLVLSEPLVLFYAESGAGKSSLINTRLVPGLRQEGFEILPIGRVSGELPAGISQVGNIFIFNLLLSLDQGRDHAGRLTHTSLSDYLSAQKTYGQRHKTEPSDEDDYGKPSRILIIDQFEEILTAHLDRWQEREDFFRQLGQAMSRDALLWVVLVMREDYVAALDPYARWLPGKLRARFYMQRMGYQAALEAVKKPAEQFGRPFASGVAEALVDNLRQIRVHGQARPQPGESVEPVQLQVVCYQLWENLKGRPPAEISHRDLQELGDVDTALAQFYEQALARVLAETDESEIELRNWFERQLITEAGTRGTVYQGPEKTGGLSNRTVELLADQFLLRAEIRAGGTWYELVHDRFVEPILRANLDWGARQSDLVRLALAWEASGRNEDNLYRGQQLKAALASVSGQRLEPLVAEFLAASEKFNQALEEKEAMRQRELEQAQALAEAERRRAEERARSASRLLRLAVALAAVFLLAVGAAIYAWTQQQRAQEQEQIAREQASAALAAERTAEARRVEAEDARAEAVAAQEDAERSALIACSGQLAAQAQAAIVENYPQRSLLLAVEAVSPTLGAGGVRVPAAEDALWQALTNTGGLGLGMYEDSISAIAVSPSNQWLVIAAGATAYVWDVSALLNPGLTDPGAEPTILSPQEGPITAAAISPDGQWLVIAGGSLAHVWRLSDLSADPVVLRSHRDPITSVAISPDSRWLVTGGEDRTARLWDVSAWLDTGLTDPSASPIILPVQENPIAAVAISPDTGAGSRWLITLGSFDNTVRVWDLVALLNSGSATPDVEPIILTGGEHPITTITLSSDGRWLAGGADDTYLWDISLLDASLTAPDPAARPTVLPGGSFVNAVAFSPDNHWLVIGNQDASIQVWDVSALPDTGLTDLEKDTLSGHQGAVTSLAISPDSRWLVSGAVDRTALWWDLSNLDAGPVVLSGHDDAITHVAISSDTPQGTGQRWLVTGGVDRTARLWDVSAWLSTGLSAPHPAAAAPLVLPGGEGFAVTKVAISPDTLQGTGQRWLVMASEDATLRLWDLSTADASLGRGPAAMPVIKTGHQGFITDLAISPDGAWLATGGDDATVRLWDLPGAPDWAVSPVILTGHQAAINAITISHDGQWLATGGDDGIARLWDVSALLDTGLTTPDPDANSIILSGHQGSIYAMAMNSDNGWLVTAGGDGTARLWDVSALLDRGLTAADRAPTAVVLGGHESSVRAVAIAGGRWLATGDDSGAVRLWRMESPGSPPSEPIILSGHEARITAVAFSPDNGWLVTASADATARLWDVSALPDRGLTAADPAPTPVVLRGHERSILDIAISPDGRWLATGSFDGTARLWDVSALLDRGLTAPDPASSAIVLRGHERGIFSVAISPDTPQGTGNDWLVTGSADGTARLWSLNLGELTDLACRTAGRNFTPAEWASYFPGQAYRVTCPGVE